MIQFTTWHIFVRRIVALSMIFLAAPSLAPGQTTGSGAGKEEAYDTKELHQGILPLKDYTGDLKTRSHLLGDWGGLRSELAKKGIVFRGWLTPLLQGVAEGGAETGSEFGASMDFWGDEGSIY